MPLHIDDESGLDLKTKFLKGLEVFQKSDKAQEILAKCRDGNLTIVFTKPTKGGTGARVEHTKVYVDASIMYEQRDTSKGMHSKAVEELTESTLFEMQNWLNNDFNTRLMEQVKQGGIDINEYGRQKAENEGKSAWALYRIIEESGRQEQCSKFGEGHWNTGNENKSQDKVAVFTANTPHNKNAGLDEEGGHRTRDMYAFQCIKGMDKPQVLSLLDTCIPTVRSKKAKVTSGGMYSFLPSVNKPSVQTKGFFKRLGEEQKFGLRFGKLPTPVLYHTCLVYIGYIRERELSDWEVKFKTRFTPDRMMFPLVILTNMPTLLNRSLLRYLVDNGSSI